MAVNVILRPTPDASQDGLVELELPQGVDVGHEFTHEGADWRIIGFVTPADTPLKFRGTGAWVAAPRPKAVASHLSVEVEKARAYA